MKNIFYSYTLLFGSLLASPSFACPLCHTPTAVEVREDILKTGQDGDVIAAILGPFLVLAIVLGLLNCSALWLRPILPGRDEERK